MSSNLEFPVKKFYDVLSNTNEVEKKLKFFINEYKNHNMHWIYQTISTFQKILSSNKESPLAKFNALLAIKNCFDTCEYALVTLIQVFLLNKITQIALFRSKIKDDSLIATYFSTEGYKEAQHKDLKKISFNFVMLATQFIFVSAQIKKFRCVQNIQIKQESKYAMNAQFLNEKGIKRPQKFSFFLSDYVKDSNKKYQNKLKQFEDQLCEIYSEYFLGIIIAEIQTGKKGPLQIRNLLSYGDAYLTSAMINLCEDELSSMQDGFQNKKKYLNLFNEFVRWGDIEAILMVNNSDFITQISVNICTVRGDVNINQGQNIYPQIQGRRNEKKQFYTDFLRCIETWAQCIPLNEQGLQSNVRRIYIFLKQEKKFKFPQNIVLKRYKKQLQQNIKKNEERNQKLLQIINNIDEQDREDENNVTNFINNTKKTQKIKKEEPINFEFLQNKIKNVQKVLQEIISMKENQKQAGKKLTLKFDILKEFNENWAEWLQQIDLQTQSIQQSDEQRLQQIIINGDQTMQAVEIINPLIEMFKKNKIGFQQFLKRIKQNLEIHQDLTVSRSKQLDLTKSMGKSVKKDLSNTIHKSILKQSHKKVMSSSKADVSNHHQSRHLAASIYKSKVLGNQNTNLEKSNMVNSLYKSHHKSGLSSIRHSRIHQKLQRIKQNSSQIGQLIQSRNHAFQSAQEYFQQNNSLGLKNEKKILNVKDNSSSISSSMKSVQRQSNSKNLQKRVSLKSSRQNQLSELIQSHGSSKNFKSQKNITVVSKNFSQKQDVLEQDSKKVVEAMDISDEAEKIVVQYSDIDQNQIQKKANQRQKQQILKSQQKKSKTNKIDEAFLKVKIQQKKVQKVQKKQNVNLQKSSTDQYLRSPKNEGKKATSQNDIISRNESNKIKSIQQRKNPKIESPLQVKVSSSNKISNKFIPFDQDYGGKQLKINKFDEAVTPRMFENLQKTKKSQSKISVTSDDKNQSIRSSKSIRQKIKNRISLKNSQISQRRSLLKDPTQRSLQSQIRAMKLQEGSNQSRSLSRKKQGIRVTQLNEKSKLKMDSNQQYNYLPKGVLQNDQNDLSKTKKISQSKIDSRLKEQQYQTGKYQKQRINISRNSRDVSSSSLGGRPYRQGISLSLGKRGSILRNQSSLLKRASILKKKEPQTPNKQKEGPQDKDELRPQYFNKNMKRQKHSNISQIKRKLQDDRSECQSVSSCGDLIHLPDNRPMVQSHYSNKDLKNRSYEKLGFKNYIQKGLKEELIPQKNQQMQSLMKERSKRQQIQKFIQHNPNSRKAKSQQKVFYGSLQRDKSTQKEVSYLQSRLKALQQESKNMKTKLAVKDQEVKSFRNTSQKMQFSNPSQSFYTGSDGFKTSRLGSQKGNFSPMTHQFHHSGFHDSQLTKHAKSSQYNQYFQKVKGNTFKKTLLKSKCLIEKQDQIEIGCMSVRKQDFSLEVTVFLTPLRFDLTDINYSVIHDQNLSTQCHPKKVINIELKKQQKISIKMNVKRVPFSIPQFQLTYKSKSQYSTNYFRLPIPILFNKFCQLQSVTPQSLQSKLIVPDRAMVTSQFKLNTKVIKLEKIKQILPNFSYSKNKDFQLLTSYGIYKEISFWLIIKINQKNKTIIKGILNQGQNMKILQFLMVTLKNIFEAQK